MSYVSDSIKLEAKRRADIIDLLHNIAGFNDANLYISSHAILVSAVREWRESARKLLDDEA